MSFKVNFFSLLIFFSVVLSVSAQVKLPNLSGPVIDQARLLNEQEFLNLSKKLHMYKEHAQLQVWTLSSLLGENIEQLALRAADQWQLGQRGKDNGLLVVVAKKEKKIRIEVGRGLEGKIPDVMAGRIIDHILTPAFRKGDFFFGLWDSSTALLELSGAVLNQEQGKALLSREIPSKRRNIDIFIFILFIVLSIFLRTGFFFPSGMRGGGRYGRRVGGRGGWSGGGGGFGGGGASGSW